MFAKCFALFALVAAASATPIAERDLYYPAPTSPTASTHWTVGQQATVTWDISTIPVADQGENIPFVYLMETASYGGGVIVQPLAENFPAEAGSVTFTVPSVAPGSYFIELGTWGQTTPQFTIDA